MVGAGSRALASRAGRRLPRRGGREPLLDPFAYIRLAMQPGNVCVVRVPTHASLIAIRPSGLLSDNTGGCWDVLQAGPAGTPPDSDDVHSNGSGASAPTAASSAPK